MSWDHCSFIYSISIGRESLNLLVYNLKEGLSWLIHLVIVLKLTRHLPEIWAPWDPCHQFLNCVLFCVCSYLEVVCLDYSIHLTSIWHFLWYETERYFCAISLLQSFSIQWLNSGWEKRVKKASGPKSAQFRKQVPKRVCKTAVSDFWVFREEIPKLSLSSLNAGMQSQIRSLCWE